MFRKRRPSARGQGLVEYALILTLVAIAIIVILSVVGKQLGEKFCDVIIELGGTPPDSLNVCRAPRIILEGIAGNQTVSGSINVEAVVRTNHGLVTDYTAHTMHVDFYIGDTLVNHEEGWRYCLAGGPDGGAPCNDFSLAGMSSGPHILHVIATDTTTNLTGDVALTFNIG